MAITFDEMSEIIEDAEFTIREVNIRVNKMAGLIGGKLQSCNVTSWTLCNLKKELKRYNMHTGEWKD